MIQKPKKVVGLILKIISFFLLFSFVFLLIFSSSMGQLVDRDEHQFIASAKMLQENNLLPYVDYVFTHMPYLVFINAFLFKYFDRLVLTARMVSVLSSFLILLIAFLITYRLFNKFNFLIRITISLGAVSLFFNHPLFIYVGNLAWNNTLPLLLTFTAFILCVYAFRQKKPRVYLILCGFLLGLSIGLRLTFALLPIPFIIMIYFYPAAGGFKSKIKLIIYFAIGMVVALIPLIYLFFLSPQKLVFCNFTMIKLNTLFRAESDYPLAMTIGSKLHYLKEVFIDDHINLFLTVTFLYLLIGIFSIRGLKIGDRFETIFVLVLMPFLIITAFAPTPLWPQHFYTLIFFIIVGVICALKNILDKADYKNIFLGIFLVLIIIVNTHGKYTLSNLRYYLSVALSPEQWKPIRAYMGGKEINNIINKGKVLTFLPTIVLEGGGDIYTEFTVGQFIYRTGHLLNEDTRLRYKIISKNEIDSFLKKNQPEGIYVVGEGIEAPLFNYAQSKTYKQFVLMDGSILFVKPKNK